MLLNESQSRIAITVWALTWLPGLALATWRGAGLLRTNRIPRAVVESGGILTLPMVAFGLYAASDAQRYALARGVPITFGYLWSAAQLAVPYAVSAAYVVWALRSDASQGIAVRWWVGLILGLLSVPLLVPGLFMAQLMVIFGGR
jgi:hypothetical protein